MAIKRVIPITLDFEGDDGEIVKSFDLKVSSFDKKKRKKLKAYGEELDAKHKGFNEQNKNIFSLEEAFNIKTEDFEDAKTLVQSDPENTSFVKQMIAARKKMRKAKKALLEAQKTKVSEDTGELSDIKEQIFKKQIELMVVNSQELIDYIKEHEYPFDLIVGEIFRLLGAAKKKS